MSWGDTFCACPLYREGSGQVVFASRFLEWKARALLSPARLKWIRCRGTRWAQLSAPHHRLGRVASLVPRSILEEVRLGMATMPSPQKHQGPWQPCADCWVLFWAPASLKFSTGCSGLNMEKMRLPLQMKGRGWGKSLYHGMAGFHSRSHWWQVSGGLSEHHLLESVMSGLRQCEGFSS